MKSLFFAALFLSGIFSALTPLSAKEKTSGDPAKGFYVFSNICNQCHGMTQLHYGDMAALGIPAKELQAWAACHELPDGLDDEGHLKKRSANLFDAVKLPYPTENAARKANHQDLPPDLSHLSSLFENAGEYVEKMLLAYQTPPADVKLEPGLFYNPVAFTRHHRFKMPPPFQQEAALNLLYPDGQHPTDQTMAKDVRAFLEWADDPHQKARQVSALLILLYLAVMGLFAFVWRAHVWKK